MHESFGAGRSLADAFPTEIRAAADTVVLRLPPASHRALGKIEVDVGGEPVVLPYRIYNPQPTAVEVAHLSPLEEKVLHCLYSRHHDGFVRQASAEVVLGCSEPWAVPFVLQLVGEYVGEIVEAIATRLAAVDRDPVLASAYARLFEENPDFVRVTRQRTISYWSCYYRRRYVQCQSYPGVILLDRLARLASHPHPAPAVEERRRV